MEKVGLKLNIQKTKTMASGPITSSMNFQMFKLDLEKAEEPENKLPTSIGSSKKQESSKKKSTLLTVPKP